jgi:hypothetical protein
MSMVALDQQSQLVELAESMSGAASNVPATAGAR